MADEQPECVHEAAELTCLCAHSTGRVWLCK